MNANADILNTISADLLVPDLTEARRLLAAGMKLTRLVHNTKRPISLKWHLPNNYAKTINPAATGYGLPLAANNLCSIDPDRVEHAAIGMSALGFNLEDLMQAGARTRSTRKGSGGRSLFAAPEGCVLLLFTSPETGCVLELRATRTNLQDVVPGLTYIDKSGELCAQTFANEHRSDAPPELPKKFAAWWLRCSTDLEYYRSQQRLFFAALPFKAHASEALSVGESKALAFDAKAYRVPFNESHDVEEILIAHEYVSVDGGARYAPPTATGAPSVRAIPKRVGLWRSDHASDPLHGTFDAWIAYVVLEHGGDLQAAKDAQDAIQRQQTLGRMTALPTLEMQALSSGANKQPTDIDMGSVESMVAKTGTEHAVAVAFAMRFNGRVKFDYQSGSWLTYTGTHWARQSTGLVSHYCREMAAAVAKKCQRAGFIAGVERLAKTDPIIATDSTFFDHDNYLFNCPDGTYDLRDGTSREHMPSDQLANIAEVAPAAPGDYGERFPQFLNEVTQGDTEMARFLQVSLGACLSGALENHHLMFWVGNGRNGKNTLGDLVMEVMGSYARKIPNNVLMKSKNERHPTEIADLKGARLVVASEIDQGAHWDEARINELTGDTTIKARFMHGNLFEFKRSFKILIYGNHRPRLQSATDAMRSRLKIVRFGASFLGREDPDLPAKLRAEKGNVLRWLMDGHQMWIEMGKKLPDFAAMREELEDYVDAQGAVKNWIDEALIIDLDGGSAWLKASEGYLRYKGWKEQRGEAAFSMTVWGDEMSKCFKKRRAKSGNFYSTRLVPYGEELKH